MFVQGLELSPPPSGFVDAAVNSFDTEDLDLLHPSRLPRAGSNSIQTEHQADPLKSVGSGDSLRRSSSNLAGAVTMALKRTSSQVSRSSSAGAKEILSALDHTMSGDFEGAVDQVQTAADKVKKNGVPHFLARVLICVFFLDNCLAAYQNWQFHQTDMMQQRINRYPHRYQDPGYPYFQLFVVAPCTLLTMLGVKTRLTMALLVLDMLRDSTGIILQGLKGALVHKMVMDEMAAKHLAMLGASVLLLVHEFHGQTSANTVAGMLLDEGNKQISKVKSFVLLVSRLLLTVLFLTVGYSQIVRTIKRDYQWYNDQHFLRRDGHDNNFLLVEALLAVPFVLGYKTSRVVPLLALTLLAEAFFCWSPFEHWPSVQYQAHVRNHFATNLGSAGGLLMLMSYGTGRFTVDKLLSKQS